MSQYLCSMINRMQSARERTGLYLLALVLIGGGGGNAVAASQKKPSTVQKKSVAAQKTVKPQSRNNKKSAATSPKRTVSKNTSAVAAVVPAAGKDLPIGQEDKFRPTLSTSYVPSDLVKIPAEATLGGKEIKLRKAAAESMEAMVRDAAADGVTLKVVSGYRDFAHQNRLYQSALKRHGKNQKMVGRPGRSEHFLGTTVDVTNTNPGHLLKPAFGKSEEYRWLEAKAPEYGWKFTVRAGVNGRKAHQDEPWHIRYMGDVEKPAAETQVASQASVPDLMTSLRSFLGEKKDAPGQAASAAKKLARTVAAAMPSL